MAASAWQGEDQDFDPFDDFEDHEAALEEQDYLASLLQPPTEPTGLDSALPLPVDVLASQEA